MNPETIICGIAAIFKFTFADYSETDGCSISARLIGGSTSIDIASSNAGGSGTAWTLTIPTTATADLTTAGSYTLLILATDGTTEVIAASVAVNLLLATATDLRSTARVTLEALEAMLEGKADKDQASISYNGRSISRLSLEDVQKAIGVQERIVKAEENKAAGIGRIQSVKLGFKNA